MKTSIFYCIGIILLLSTWNAGSKEVTEKSTAAQPEVITVMSSPDLHELVSDWASGYNSITPEVQINMTQGTTDGPFLNGTEEIGFISGRYFQSVDPENSWSIVVGRDIIVPVMNTANPRSEEILQTGISQAAFSRILESEGKQNWGVLLAKEDINPVHIYVVDDEYIKKSLAAFLGMENIPEGVITLGNRDEIIQAVQNDPNALGFCRIVQIMGSDNQELAENIRLVPIDKNGNGSLEYMENIYGDAGTFLRGVWIGKYVKSLYSNVYAVSKVKPTRESEVAFLTWVATDGQQYVKMAGLTGLVDSESKSQLSKINAPLVIGPAAPKGLNPVTGALLLLAAGLLALLALGGAVRLITRKKHAVNEPQTSPIPVFNENAVVVPKGLYFDKSHTWAFMEKDGIVTIGIDDFIQHVTGPITRVEMKNQGERIKKGDLLLTIVQSGKQLNLYSPVSGTIQKQNEILTRQSSYLNNSPYGDGWVYRIEPSKWYKEIQLLEIGEKYSKWLSDEFTRLKDFLAREIKPADPEYALVVLQDGGELKDGILADFGPEIWEEFQTRFIDTSK